MSYTMHKVIKTGVSTFNPYIHDMPVGGVNITVLHALKNAFLQEKQVFAGSVDEFVKLGEDAGLNKRDLLKGFKELQGATKVDGRLRYRSNNPCSLGWTDKADFRNLLKVNAREKAPEGERRK